MLTRPSSPQGPQEYYSQRGQLSKQKESAKKRILSGYSLGVLKYHIRTMSTLLAKESTKGVHGRLLTERPDITCLQEGQVVAHVIVPLLARGQ
jgi:hypothetical protein